MTIPPRTPRVGDARDMNMPKGISLHLGLNTVDPVHYQGWDGALNACEADAHAMERICSARGFATGKLLSAKATRAAVDKALRKAASTLKAGDSFVFSYSGHGGQIPDLNGDEDDALDETWCLYDGEMLDDELFEAWARFKAGVRITVFSDSCHSGTVVKMMMRAGLLPPALSSRAAGSDQPRPRVMPPEVMRETYTANQSFYDKLSARVSSKARVVASVVLLSGCQDNQLSMDGPFNGAYTGQLLATYRNGNFPGSYKELQTRIRTKMPLTQSPNYLETGTVDSTHQKMRCFTI